MQLIIKDGIVVTTHTDEQIVAHLYPGCEAIIYAGEVKLGDPDPRTTEEKALYYRDQRRNAYPAIGDQLDMIYHDKIEDTTSWQDAIAAVKTLYPKV